MKIEVILKRLYGREVFYPMSDDAKRLCTLLKAETLTKNQLLICKEGEWPIKIIVEDYKLD